MSVLSCNRHKCENIMCDRYSQRFGYICDECFEELINTTDQGMREFMESPKTPDLTLPNFSWANQCDKEFQES
jgi:hypothetical protein